MPWITTERTIPSFGRSERSPKQLRQLRVVIAGQAALIEERFQGALSEIQGCTIEGVALEEDQAVSLVASLAPEIVILDPPMPHRIGIGILKHIRQHSSAAVIIIFTADESVILREACLEAGADYYFNTSQMRDVVAICQLWINR